MRRAYIRIDHKEASTTIQGREDGGFRVGDKIRETLLEEHQ